MLSVTFHPVCTVPPVRNVNSLANSYLFSRKPEFVMYLSSGLLYFPSQVLSVPVNFLAGSGCACLVAHCIPRLGTKSGIQWLI